MGKNKWQSSQLLERAYYLYRDKFIEDPRPGYPIMVRNAIQLQSHLLRVYDGLLLRMHKRWEATYGSLAHDFSSRNMA